MQITIILAAFLALVAGADAGHEDGLIAAVVPELSSVQIVLVVSATTCALLVLQRTVGLLLLAALQKSMGRRGFWRLSSRVDLVMRFILIGVFALQLTVGGWAFLFAPWGRMPAFVWVHTLVLLAPFLVAQLGSWYFFYPVNRFIRELVVSGQLAEGLSTRPVWTRKQYLNFHIRHGLLIILVPLLLILGVRDMIYRMVGGGDVPAPAFLSRISPEVLVGAAVLVVFLLVPLLLRHIWRTRPLPAGPLREKLEGFCGGMGLRYRDMLLWDTYSSVANAAVMGLLAPVRFLLLSDALIENMPDEQIEAVFGHEAGHVRHHHILFLALFVFGSISGLSLIWEYLGPSRLEGLQTRLSLSQNQFAWLMVGWGGVLGLGWMHLFGWVSRRFEAQADVHAAEAIGNHWQKISPTEPAEGESTVLHPHGAAVATATLQRIARINGMAVEARSWRHASIYRRCLLLMSLAQKPGLYRRFRRQLLAIKWGILLLVIISLIGWWLLNRSLPAGDSSGWVLV